MLRTLTQPDRKSADDKAVIPLDLEGLGVGELVRVLKQANLTAITQAFSRQTASGSEDPVVHFYELFLSEYDKEQKVKRGVFYTPNPVGQIHGAGGGPDSAAAGRKKSGNSGLLAGWPATP